MLSRSSRSRKGDSRSPSRRTVQYGCCLTWHTDRTALAPLECSNRTHAVISPADLNGAVGRSQTTVSTARPSSSSRRSTAWQNTGQSDVSSRASSAGLRNGTSAPSSTAIREISGSSVDTIIFETSSHCRATSMAHPRRGRPPRSARFFRGTPFEPPRQE